MDRYSRFVAYLKVILPLAALALLSTLFLLSRGSDPEVTLPFARKDIEERVRAQQITAPFFSGTTADGDEITVSARLARPFGSGGLAEAEELHARMKMAQGGLIVLRSNSGAVDPATDAAQFIGGVEITTSTGFVVRTERLDATIGTFRASTPGEVRALGPVGDLTAGQMEIGAKNPGEPMHMVFKNGVKLIYDPQKPPEQ
ncbi:hypothetical protein [Antarcticimicrobium sediminis]|uniref:Lipopolysaccharide export system protein LptC n=1 Tax=Antarcticimicrobium sediminis TaxID=2546227 RepID=A0A4R5EQU1_9RHOB|nr:hypothetical protein [Antarcticimicrobium sediminis]TDE37057.1 hypothetical protein E1B25_13255 [Antarcticimicrobium sediminis]